MKLKIAKVDNISLLSKLTLHLQWNSIVMDGVLLLFCSRIKRLKTLIKEQWLIPFVLSTFRYSILKRQMCTIARTCPRWYTAYTHWGKPVGVLKSQFFTMPSLYISHFWQQNCSLICIIFCLLGGTVPCCFYLKVPHLKIEGDFTG